jgi:hypothetical protein
MDEIKDIVKLTCAVCAQDGIISSVELDTAFRLINTSFNKISRKDFDLCVEEFFEEDRNLEKYLISLPESIDVEKILEVCFESAGSDGLDVRENFAFDKICKHFQVDAEEFINK